MEGKVLNPGSAADRAGPGKIPRTNWPLPDHSNRLAAGSHEFKYVKGCPANRSLPGSCTYLTTAA